MLWFCAAATAANVFYMLVDPLGWYGAVEGIPDTGSFNPHYVRDIGGAYLTLAVMTAASARWLGNAVALPSAVALYPSTSSCMSGTSRRAVCRSII